MFKVGDKVICIDNDNGYFDLIIGEEYSVINSYEDRVDLRSDDGGVAFYFNQRFKLKESPVEFQVGDIVEYGGAEGVVTDVSESEKEFPVLVNFNNFFRSFTKEGMFEVFHTEPLLKLVSRPKKKEKRLVKTTVQYSPSLGRVLKDSEGSNDSISVELEKEIEVEV